MLRRSSTPFSLIIFNFFFLLVSPFSVFFFSVYLCSEIRRRSGIPFSLNDFTLYISFSFPLFSFFSLGLSRFWNIKAFWYSKFFYQFYFFFLCFSSSLLFLLLICLGSEVLRRSGIPFSLIDINFFYFLFHIVFFFFFVSLIPVTFSLRFIPVNVSHSNHSFFSFQTNFHLSFLVFFAFISSPLAVLLIITFSFFFFSSSSYPLSSLTLVTLLFQLHFLNPSFIFFTLLLLIIFWSFSSSTSISFPSSVFHCPLSVAEAVRHRFSSITK